MPFPLCPARPAAGPGLGRLHWGPPGLARPDGTAICGESALSAHKRPLILHHQPTDRPADVTLPGTEMGRGSTDVPRRIVPAGHVAGERGRPAHGGEPGGKPDLAAAVAAAQRGDERAFRHHLPGRAAPAAALPAGDDAEDVASEAWLQITLGPTGSAVIQTGSVAGPRPSPGPRAMDHQRRQRRWGSQPSATSIDDLAVLAARHDTAESALETRFHRGRDDLQPPRDQAEAVMLRVVMGLDAGSAGRVLGKKAVCRRTAAYRGLRRGEPPGPPTRRI